MIEELPPVHFGNTAQLVMSCALNLNKTLKLRPGSSAELSCNSQKICLQQYVVYDTTRVRCRMHILKVQDVLVTYCGNLRTPGCSWHCLVSAVP